MICVCIWKNKTIRYQKGSKKSLALYAFSVKSECEMVVKWKIIIDQSTNWPSRRTATFCDYSKATKQKPIPEISKWLGRINYGDFNAHLNGCQLICTHLMICHTAISEYWQWFKEKKKCSRQIQALRLK